jgi:glycosyltransferase involved in cell wall biosynthesis
MFARDLLLSKINMKIGVETSVFLYSLTGVGVYTHSLIHALRDEFPSDEIINYQFGSPVRNKTWRTRTDSVLRDTLWIKIALPLRLLKDRVDVVFLPAQRGPLVSPCPSILTILDLIILHHPEWYDQPWLSFYTRRILPAVVKGATRIITISEHSRRDIIDYFHVAPEKIEVIHCGTNRALFKPLSAEDISPKLEQKYQVRRPYFLFVGSIEPRKNPDIIIKAYERFRDRDGDPVSLIFVGNWGWKFESVRQAYERSRYKKDMRFVGYVPAEDLPLFYNGAECSLYPSSYEGFGIPVLEAMSCGCPVITTSVSSLPEVGGDAALYVSPGDSTELAEAMARVHGDEALRKELSKKGLSRSSQFSWTGSARKLHRLFEDLAP